MSFKPPRTDVSAGMEVFATQGPPCAGRIKVREDDFQVSELLRLDDLVPAPIPGYFPVYRIEKHGIDTFHVARILSERLRGRVSFAGIKDKRARAIQFVSPTSTRSLSPQRVEETSFVAELIGYIPRPVSRRMMVGNSFKVLISSPGQRIREAIEDVYEACRSRRVPNFFGLQRFGSRDPITHRIGRELVKGKFEKAVKLLLFEPRVGEPKNVSEARAKAAAGEFAASYKIFGPKQDLEKIVARHLERKKGDFLGAFRALPIAIRRFFVHAYASYIFNRTLSGAIGNGFDISEAMPGDNWCVTAQDQLGLGEVRGSKEPPTAHATPLVQLLGYAFRDYGSRFDQLTLKVLDEEKVSPKQFYIKDAQELSTEGGFRSAPLLARELGYSLEDSGASLSFTLAKGEYATVLLREILKPENPVAAGLGS